MIDFGVCEPESCQRLSDLRFQIGSFIIRFIICWSLFKISHPTAIWNLSQYFFLINSCNFYRALLYPWLITGGKPTPVFVASLAFSFCTLNGYIQARYLTKYAHYETSWLTNPCFVIGVLFFLTGMAINIHSDHILRNLRKPGETGYKIPTG